jgi:hypothetical protein
VSGAVREATSGDVSATLSQDAFRLFGWGDLRALQIDAMALNDHIGAPRICGMNTCAGFGMGPAVNGLESDLESDPGG